MFKITTLFLILFFSFHVSTTVNAEERIVIIVELEPTLTVEEFKAILTKHPELITEFQELMVQDQELYEAAKNDYQESDPEFWKKLTDRPQLTQEKLPALQRLGNWVGDQIRDTSWYKSKVKTLEHEAYSEEINEKEQILKQSGLVFIEKSDPLDIQWNYSLYFKALNNDQENASTAMYSALKEYILVIDLYLKKYNNGDELSQLDISAQEKQNKIFQIYIEKKQKSLEMVESLEGDHVAI